MNGIAKKLLPVSICCAVLGFSGPLSAEILKYEDLEGRVYFTDKPLRGPGYRLLWRSGTDNAKSSANVDFSRYRENRDRYAPLIEKTARKLRIRPELLHAIVRAESAYDPRAQSRAGAVGLMQLMPATARRYGISDAWDPAENLEAGARYLLDLLKLFRYDLKLALAAYNAGEQAVIEYGHQVPPYAETQNYVDKVLSFFQQESRS